MVAHIFKYTLSPWKFRSPCMGTEHAVYCYIVLGWSKSSEPDQSKTRELLSLCASPFEGFIFQELYQLVCNMAQIHLRLTWRPNMSHWALPENIQLVAAHEVVTLPNVQAFPPHKLPKICLHSNADFKSSMTTHLWEDIRIDLLENNSQVWKKTTNQTSKKKPIRKYRRNTSVTFFHLD